MSDTAERDNSAHRQIAARFIDGRSWAMSPRVSPDGRRVAFVVASTSLQDNTTRTRVWLDDAPVTGGEYDGNPAWSPDGRWLAFTSRRGEKKGDSTLHVMPADGHLEIPDVAPSEYSFRLTFEDATILSQHGRLLPTSPSPQ